MTRVNIFASLFFITACAISTTQCFALPEDREQPINVQSDSAEKIKEKVYYRGNVTMTQGTITIKGETVTVESVNDKVQRLIADGGPAHFSQKPSADEDLVNATANNIDYQLVSDTVLLTKNATVEQTDSSIHGERIEYDIKEQRVRASGIGTGDNGRVRMILQPQTEPSQNDQPQTNPTTTPATGAANIE
jgi:lipopolysaccharide export system protein LptA